MGLYGFKERFVPFILSGEKTHTIRAIRVHPDRPGNTLHLYTGLRTKKAKLLMRVECVKIEEIVIDRFGLIPDRGRTVIRIDDLDLDLSEMKALAQRDGFPNLGEMMKFWQGRLPFRGNIIHWAFPGTRGNSNEAAGFATGRPRNIQRSTTR